MLKWAYSFSWSNNDLRAGETDADNLKIKSTNFSTYFILYIKYTTTKNQKDKIHRIPAGNFENMWEPKILLGEHVWCNWKGTQIHCSFIFGNQPNKQRTKIANNDQWETKRESLGKKGMYGCRKKRNVWLSELLTLLKWYQ